jgi:hypothetical protein
MHESKPSDRAAEIDTWASFYGLPADDLRERLKDVTPSYGPNKHGQAVAFYWEADVRRVCADLLFP